MKILVLDVESTTWSKGSPFDSRNFLVCFSYWWEGKAEAIPYNEESKKYILSLLEQADLVVGFNFKFDMHWLRKVGIMIHKPIYDVQLGYFYYKRQTTPYPSLNGVCEEFGLGQKIDVIKEKYWSQGVNTHEIPWEELAQYAAEDARLTYEAYRALQERIPEHMRKLIKIAMEDQKVLEEMEWNGLRFDRAKSLRRAERLKKMVDKVQSRLNLEHNIPCFNWGSGDHLSALLYGGKIVEEVRVPNGVYKTGAKVGQQRFKKEEREYILPRRYKPLPKTESKKPGVWSTDEDTMTKLGGDLCKAIMFIRKMNKLISSYLDKFPAMQDEHHWGHEYLYGQYNQCVARTGRLSSDKPNQQNIPFVGNLLLISRYDS